jgi:hypothetical protein
MKAAGWTAPKVADFLQREFGIRPSPSIVRSWCKPASEEAMVQDRERHRRAYARRRKRTVSPRLSEDWKIEQMRAMYLRGVSLRAIGQVSAVWWDEEQTERKVRRRLGLKVGEVIRARGVA